MKRSPAEFRKLAIEAAHYRDLRDHAGHEPEGRFAEELFTRLATSLKVPRAVAYFRRAYELVTAVRAT